MIATTRSHLKRLLPTVVASLLGFFVGMLLTNSTEVARATHDPAISYYFPSAGWASQAHGQGHDGYGTLNFPTWYGGTTATSGYFYSGSPAGENACASNRYSNMNAAATLSVSSTTGSSQLPDWPNGLKLSYVGCNVALASRTAFSSWVVATGAGSPGYVFHRVATSPQCASQGLSYPCGAGLMLPN